MDKDENNKKDYCVSNFLQDFNQSSNIVSMLSEILNILTMFYISPISTFAK